MAFLRNCRTDFRGIWEGVRVDLSLGTIELERSGS